MKDLKIIDSLVTKELAINEDSQYNNLDADKVVVAENVVVRIFGTVKDISLKKNSRIYIHGTIKGNVLNDGGEIHVFGDDK